MVLVNGGNFIDGLNGLLLKYFDSLFVYLIQFADNPYVDRDFLLNLSIILSIILLFNLFGFCIWVTQEHTYYLYYQVST